MQIKSIKTKILLSTLLIVAVAVLITNGQAYWVAKEAMIAKTYENLTAIRDSKARQISALVREKKLLVFTHSSDQKIIDAMKAFRDAFQTLKKKLPATDIPYSEALKPFYQKQYLPRFKELNGSAPLLAKNWPSRETTHYLQYHYLAENPHPLHEKKRLIASGQSSEYHRIHAKYHPKLCELLDTFDYQDVYLVDHKTGDIVYSCAKEIDFATNLLTGVHRKSNLAKAFRFTHKIGVNSVVKMSDFALYAPSFNAPASFIASPILENDQQVGVFIAQMPVKPINQVMANDFKWFREGLGNTGETYLIGKNYKMRNDSRFLLENPQAFFEQQKSRVEPAVFALMKTHETTILYQEVRTEASADVLRGNLGTKIVKNYRGMPVVSSYKPLFIPDEEDLEWAILSEINVLEINEPIVELRNRILLITPFITFFIIVVGSFISGNLTKPILLLTKSAKKLSEDLSTRVSVETTDEIGTLATTFNLMAEELENAEEALRISKNQLKAQNDQMRADLVMAAEVQQSMYSAITVPPFLQMATQFIPHSEVSGDLYHCYHNQERSFDFFLGDATGHGVSAALLTIMANFALHEKASEASIPKTLDFLNQMLDEHTPQEKFVSGFYLNINADGRLRYANAGHPIPLVIPQDGGDIVKLDQAVGMILGVFPKEISSYEEHSDALKPGDKIFLYTDGITEAFNENQDMYRIERLIAFLEKHRDTPLETTLVELLEDLKTFSNQRPSDDDISIFAFQYLPQ